MEQALFTVAVVFFVFWIVQIVFDWCSVLHDAITPPARKKRKQMSSGMRDMFFWLALFGLLFLIALIALDPGFNPVNR